ncbi:Hypothetical predicted protein [Octopus vulgaris]|uniref:Uncharacterized protein n=1 Tax=Octopus vulgaris TaxID=6645 RepID=A0AA36BXG6_OCTVU|nr:Hypothetical predicted protein [Octopus vulgaris]
MMLRYSKDQSIRENPPKGTNREEVESGRGSKQGDRKTETRKYNQSDTRSKSQPRVTQFQAILQEQCKRDERGSGIRTDTIRARLIE